MNGTAVPPRRDKAPYDDAFFDALNDGSLASACHIVPIVWEYAQPRRVVDIGCGRGAWLRAFLECGAESVHGYDGAYVDASKLLIDPAYFTSVDLSRPFELNTNADLAVCLEVAEHLPARVALSLIRALTEAAPLVLFSAAIPGQGGTHHVNEQWPDYWKALFERFGYHRLDPIRPRIWRDRRVERWYRQNIYVYASVSAIAASAALRAEKVIADSQDLDLIDDLRYWRYRTFSGLLGELPAACWRAAKRRLSRVTC